MKNPLKLLIPTLLLATSISSGAATTQAPAAATPAPAPLLLAPLGDTRALSPHLFGATINPFVEKILGDPKREGALKPMSIGLTRFPSGSQANYHDWRTGLPTIKVEKNSSNEIKSWLKVATKIADANPTGISAEAYAQFSNALGAELILVPNLESSTPEEQAAWFADLKKKGVVSKRIELGNAFYFAMRMDPNVLAKWPDVQTAMKTMRRFHGALNNLYAPGTKVAVQAAGSAYDVAPYGTSPLYDRLKKWDEGLHPEPWFQAVTLHLYPRATEFLEAGVTGGIPLFKSMMGRADQGVQTVLHDIEKRLPGKEIWITEWNPRGPGRLQDQDDPVSPGMVLQLTTRMALVFLRHPSVTAALLYRLDFKEGSGYQVFVEDQKAGTIDPTATAQALAWLNEAANTSASFQRLTEQGALPVSPGGPRLEGYNEIEGGLFKSAASTTLILQNASADARTFDVKKLAGKAPKSATTLAIKNFSDPYQSPAQYADLPLSAPLVIAPYSVTRIEW